jgi:hypothetical protein
MQFPIQLVVGCCICHAQRLTFDHLTFDPFGVTKHGLTYIMLFHIHSKEHIYIYLSQYQTKISMYIPLSINKCYI